MPTTLRQRLLEKGWSEEEIAHTHNLIHSDSQQEKHASFKQASHPILYWTGLIVAIVGNLLLSVTFIPFLMILDSIQLYIILGMVGAVFGAMFNVIIKDIEHINQKHHIVAGVFIPAIALVTVYVMANVANKFNVLINNPNQHNAVVFSIIYLVCFSAPYMYYKLRDVLKSHPPATLS